MNDGTKDQFLCLLAKCIMTCIDPYEIAESDDHTTELPPGRPTAVLSGPQQVYVLT